MAMVSSKSHMLPPHLDWATCDRARLARDRAFDGLFLSGVRSTRIYCRPVCPVRPARSENVTFYATAAAAERAGFRPCLRCRPETAPGSPAWMGTATNIRRVFVDNNTTPVSFWVGSNDGASIVKVEPLE